MSIVKLAKTAGLAAKVAGFNVITVFDIAFYS
jgi:hypothetical protein